MSAAGAGPIALETLDDEALVELYVADGRKDERIFRELFKRRRDDVWRICYAFFGNRQDAEDLTQQVFFTAYRKLAQFRGQASLRTWLHRIATNSCKNELRRRSRRPEGSKTELSERESLLWSPATAESELMLKRRSDRLARAMMELSLDERDLLRLVEFEGRPYAQIAEAAALSVGAVKMRVMRARLALRAAYENLHEVKEPQNEAAP